jgi:hypothetical protein
MWLFYKITGASSPNESTTYMFGLKWIHIEVDRDDIHAKHSQRYPVYRSMGQQ